MKRAIPLAFALVLCLGLKIASAEDPALAELGLTEEGAKDVCRYAKDVLYEGERRTTWEGACNKPVPDYGKLLEIKKTDDSLPDFNHYNEAVRGVDARRKQVQAVADIFSGPEYKDTKDDKSRWKSENVRKCMVKEKCESAWDAEDIDKLEDITPPINARTFPAWLTVAEANKLLPFFLISKNEELRVQKYKELAVPLDEDKREEHCEDPKNAESCAQFAAVQKQLETNKTMINGLQDITDPNEFAAYIGEGRQREADSGMGSTGVFAQWGEASDDPNLPFKPKQTHSPDGGVVPGAVAAPPADEGYLASAKRWGAGAAAGLFLSAGMWWKLSSRNAKKEIAKEDEAAAADPTTVRSEGEIAQAEGAAFAAAAEANGMSVGEYKVYDTWKNSHSGISLDEYLTSKTGYFKNSTSSLMEKLQQGKLPNTLRVR